MATRFALVFPGQGSQTVGMMQAFAESAVVRATFDEASAVLGQDLWQLVADGPAEELNRTVNTQPVMLTAAYAMYRAWQDAGGPEPALVAGHSLGEYTALVAAGVIAFRDAVPLVRFRAAATMMISNGQRSSPPSPPSRPRRRNGGLACGGVKPAGLSKSSLSRTTLT